MKKLAIVIIAFSGAALAFTPFYFIHWSDPQISLSSSAPTTNMALAVSQINAMRPRAHFAIVCGDMSDNQDNPPAEWNICDSLFDLLLMPKYVCPGNNDLGYPNEDDWTPTRLALYRSFWGPDYYSVTLDSCHFIALNSVLLNTFSPHACYPYSLEQDSFLRYDLLNAPAGSYEHMFMFYHFPTFTTSWDEGNDVRNNICRPRRDTILAAIKEYKIPGMFAGHHHGDYLNFYDIALLQRGLTTNNGGGYRAVKVFGDGYEMFTIPLSSPIDTVPLVKIVTIAASAETVMVGQPLDFTALVDTTHYPAWTGLGFRWFFGDGDSSNLRNPSHVYADTGHYTVHFRSYKIATLGAYYKLRIIVKPATYVSEHAEKVRDLPIRVNSLSLRSRRIVFEVPMTAVLDLRLYNPAGVLVTGSYGRRYEKGRHAFNLPAGLAGGVYFLNISNAGSSQNHKVVLIQ
jgi:hypothetical protein